MLRDFKFPKISWPSRNIHGGTGSDKVQTSELLQIVDNNF